MSYRADFHIHSCLSPCASLEMSPLSIVQRAKEVGLNAIALSDHNCAFNLDAFAKVCRNAAMECLFGVEVSTTEEVHVLCLYDRLDAAIDLGERVYDSLPDIPNQAERFGDQPIIDENEDILGFADKLLIGASSYDIGSLLELVHSTGGLFVPAHIDRSVYGMVSQLGFLPEEDFDAVELTPRGSPELAQHYPIMRNSDSHQLASIGTAFTDYDVEQLTVGNIRSFLWP